MFKIFKNNIMRIIIIVVCLLSIWQLVVSVFNLAPYILPGPAKVFKTWWYVRILIIDQAIPTVIETVSGLLLAILLGVFNALILSYFRPARAWFFPVLLISQALPTFAIAPLLVVWFGYGMASKIITIIIMLFFPITNAFYDGLVRTNSEWLALAKTMNAKKWQILRRIKIPAALPRLATGIRIAATYAPIGATVGEWVGASKGLGFLMLNANARLQIDVMFAALFTLAIFTLLLYFTVDKLLRWAISW